MKPILAISSRRQERGAVLVLVAVMMLVILVTGALAVDVAALQRRGQTLQNTVDAAALGASATWVRTGDQGQAADVMLDLLEQNGLDVANEPDLRVQISFPSDEEVEITLTDDNPDVYLGGIVGLGSSIVRDARAELTMCEADCGTEAELSAPFQSVAAVGSGDGFTPIAVGTKFYGINHHGTNIACVDRVTLNQCFPSRSAFPAGVSANTDMVVHTAVVDTKIWYTGQEWNRLALFCWETVTDTPCPGRVTLDNLSRPNTIWEHAHRGGAVSYVGGKIYVFTDQHQVHCVDPDTATKCAGYPYTTAVSSELRAFKPWRAAYQTGSGMDRIIDEGNGWIYRTIRVSQPSWGSDIGVYLDCWDTQNAQPCSSFSPSKIHDTGKRYAGRLFFSRTTNGTIEGVCSTGISEISCVDLLGAPAPWIESGLQTLENQFPDSSLYVRAHGTHMYHPPSNRLFLTTPRAESTDLCWDFTSQSFCGSLYGFEAGDSTDDYGFIYEGDCIYALGHNSIFWSFTKDLVPGCPGSTALARIDKCNCNGVDFWGEIDFSFDTEIFDVFDVQILDPEGEVLLPVDGGFISLIGNTTLVDLNDIPTTYEYLEVSVYAETDGSNPWATGDAPTFKIDFATTPVLVE